MMDIYFYFFFMIPLVFLNYFIFHYFLIFMLVFFSLKSFYNFFCSLSYMFGIDNYSYWLILLSLLIGCLMFMSYNFYMNFNSFYFSFFTLFLCFMLILFFSCLNLMYMYMFFEFSLFPLMVIIFGWGYQPERLISGLYLFFYTLFASLPLLILIIYLSLFGSLFFDLNVILFLNFIFYFVSIIAFLVKFPMFIFHFWLPKAHVQAPVFGSMVLAGLLLSMGGYGIIRFMIMMEYMYFNYSYIWYSFCFIGCLLVSLICFIQGDMKSLIANSSVAHMMMCIMGLLSIYFFGVYGSFLMMIGHGFCSSGLFFICGVCYDRTLSRSFYISKGFMGLNNSVSFFWFLLCCFNMSCPPSVNFLSELMIMGSLVKYWSFSFLFLFFICFFSACFSFYLFSYSNHGLFFNLYSFCMINVREYLVLYVHIFYTIFIFFLINFMF